MIRYWLFYLILAMMALIFSVSFFICILPDAFLSYKGIYLKNDFTTNNFFIDFLLFLFFFEVGLKNFMYIDNFEK